MLSMVDTLKTRATELLEISPGQSVLQMSITDTGIGIAPEFYPKVFRPFSQMDNSNSRQYGGVGLGLALSKSMVDMLGGIISYKSSLGIGTDFTVLLPVEILEDPSKFVKESSGHNKSSLPKIPSLPSLSSLSMPFSLPSTTRFHARRKSTPNLSHSSMNHSFLPLSSSPPPYHTPHSSHCTQSHPHANSNLHPPHPRPHSPRSNHCPQSHPHANSNSHPPHSRPNHPHSHPPLHSSTPHHRKDILYQIHDPSQLNLSPLLSPSPPPATIPTQEKPKTFPTLSNSPSLSRSLQPPLSNHHPLSPSSRFTRAHANKKLTNKDGTPSLNLHVLVVEDNLMNQILIKKMLRKMSCEVEVAKHGQEALDILFEPTHQKYSGYRNFQLILMDCQMPTLDGFQTTLRIRAWENLQEDEPHLTIIALTASSSSENEKQCYLVGMDGFIAKPVTLLGLYSYLSAK